VPPCPCKLVTRAVGRCRSVNLATVLQIDASFVTRSRLTPRRRSVTWLRARDWQKAPAVALDFHCEDTDAA
jgi:hypothetical protein